MRASNERFAFKAGLSGSGVSSNNNQGIWAGPVAALALVARKGAAAPWTGAGTFTGLDTPWSIAANGSILFTGAAVSQGATVSRAGLWATVNGATSLVGKEDEPAPGTAALFSRFWGGALRENGRLAFSGRTSDGREGIWSGTLQAMSSAVRSEDIAVGAGPGRVFSDFEPPIPLSNGDFVFRGNFGLASPGFDEWGIWRHTGAGLALLGGEGLAAPGAEPGVVFESVDRAMVNDHGQVVFGGILAGPGIGENNNFGLWYSDWNDANLVKLLIREGDLLEVSSGLWKVVTGLNYLPGVSGYHGRCDSLSEDGTLAFAATFADGSSGVFTTAIPAPSTFSVLGLISAGLCRRRNAK